jgi:hypothetical protein
MVFFDVTSRSLSDTYQYSGGTCCLYLQCLNLHHFHYDHKLYQNISNNINWDSSVSIVTRLQVGQLRDQGSIPSMSKRSFLVYTVSRQSLGSTQSPIQWVLGAIFQKVKKLGCEFNNFHLMLRSHIRGVSQL